MELKQRLYANYAHIYVNNMESNDKRLRSPNNS